MKQKDIYNQRLFLDESRLNGNKKKLRLNESLPSLSIDKGLTSIDKLKSNPDIPIYLVGIISSGDKVNRNGRMYPWSILKKECERYFEQVVKEALGYGELDHPEDSATPMLKNAALIIEDIWFKGKDVWAKVKVLNAFMPQNAPGLMVRGILLNQGGIGISSRALGSLDESVNYEYDVVDEDLEIACWDFVSNASNYGSEKLQLVNEGKKKNIKGLLTESECFGGVCGIKNPLTIKQQKLLTLTEAEQTYVNVLGVERFLQEYHKNK